jgi:hypothetical protein
LDKFKIMKKNISLFLSAMLFTFLVYISFIACKKNGESEASKIPESEISFSTINPQLSVIESPTIKNQKNVSFNDFKLIILNNQGVNLSSIDVNNISVNDI